MAEKNPSSKIKSESKKIAEKTLKLIDVNAIVNVESRDDLIKINIDGEDLGLLIGYRGENIESFQLLLGIIINRTLELAQWRPVLVDVGGWRQQREEALRILVNKEIENISAEQASVELPPMPPAQRRSVHLLVGEHEGLTSESAGEGENRHVVIKKTG